MVLKGTRQKVPWDHLVEILHQMGTSELVPTGSSCGYSSLNGFMKIGTNGIILGHSSGLLGNALVKRHLGSSYGISSGLLGKPLGYSGPHGNMAFSAVLGHHLHGIRCKNKK